MTRPPFDPDAHTADACACRAAITSPWCTCACHAARPIETGTNLTRPASATAGVTRLMTDPAARVHLAAALGVVVGMLTMTLATLLALVVAR